MVTEPLAGTRTTASPATDAACALLARLVARGVRHIVVSPGSRSQALALAAAELERAGLVAVHVRIDERVAGFTALGVGRETGMPAAVVCTSGTATANLLPAVMEADHAGIPLLLLTADRPPELRGVGANQTTRQVGMFAAHVRWDRDLPVPDTVDDDGTGAQTAAVADAVDAAVDAALGAAGPRGPVHLNLPYRKPLSGAFPAWFASVVADHVDGGLVSTRSARGASDSGMARGTSAGADSDPLAARVAGAPLAARVTDGPLVERVSAASESKRAHVLPRGPRTVVVAGADAGPAAEQLAHEGGWPLVAEIVSGARFGRHLVHGHRALLRDPALGGRIQRTVVFGHPTLSREVTELLSRADVEVIALAGPGEPLDLNGATVHAADVVVENGPADRGWLGEWMRASRDAAVDLAPPAPDADALSSVVPRERLGALSAELDVFRMPLDRALLVDAVWRATWPHDRLVFGSSRLVRVADDVLGGKKVPVHANRGLAGIDGTIATATGIAVASQQDGAAGVTRVILGDLALLHDAGALLMPEGEQVPRLQVIVGNDGGGTIFDGLEVASTADADAARRVLYTPQHVDLAALAAAYGWEYRRATTRSELDQALTAPVAGRVLIEVPLQR